MKQYKIILSVLMLFGHLMYAGDGALDTSFNSTGYVILPEPTGGSQSGVFKNQVYVDATGNIYFQADTYVCRFTPAGALDTSFNAASTTPGFFVYVTSPSSFFNGMIVQPDGKVVLIGRNNADPFISQALIIRLQTDGTLDQSFNNGQPVLTPSVTLWQGAALQPDGKLIISGTSFNQSDEAQVALARFNTDGTIDTSFGGTGIVQTIIQVAGSPVFSVAGGVAVDANQKIVLLATDETGIPPLYLAILRYNSDGSLDTNFNASGSQPGVVIAGESIFPGIFPYQPNVIVQPDGKILIGYWSAAQTPNGVQILRLNQDGSLDTSFNGTGFTTFFIQELGTDFVQMLLQSDGKIVVIAQEQPSSGPLITLVVRYTSSGQLDTTFGSPNGFVEITIPIAINGTIPRGGALQQDGKIVIGGIANTTFTTEDFFVMRLLDATPLLTTTIIQGATLVSGQAQSLGFVTLYVNGTEVCVSEIVNNSWECTGLTLNAGMNRFLAVAHYPGGNVNIAGSCVFTFPATSLSVAIKNKYCPC